jgi:hypothetical protein
MALYGQISHVASCRRGIRDQRHLVLLGNLCKGLKGGRVSGVCHLAIHCCSVFFGLGGPVREDEKLASHAATSWLDIGCLIDPTNAFL